MLKNYFKTFFSIFWRRKLYSIINVSGLALGIASSLIIFLVVKNELGYDNFHEKADRTYRVTFNELDFNSNVSLALADPLREDFQWENLTQVWYQFGKVVVKYKEKRFNEKDYAFADKEFFSVFTYKWISGNPEKSLAEPNSVVLTETFANKYFGNTNPIGEVINVDNFYTLKVTGVIEDVPGNTHLPFNFLISYETIKKELGNSLTNIYSIPGGSFLYATLKENQPIDQVKKQIPGFLKKNWGNEVSKNVTLIFQPLKDIHFDQRYINNLITPTQRETYWALAGIALFIIITACINFINIATAQSIKRAKEVGVRKVLGAAKQQLIFQFLAEAAMLVLFAIAIALLLTIVFLPKIEIILNIKIGLNQLIQPTFIGLILILTIAVTLLAGLYPAFVQSAFQPVKSLKSSNIASAFKGLTLRKSLIVIQFTFSQILIIGTFIVAQQMDFFLNQDLGFSKEAIVTFFVPGKDNQEVFRQKLALNPSISSITFSSATPSTNTNFTDLSSPGLLEHDVTEIKTVDENYMDMFGLKLLAGEKIRKADPRSFPQAIVNETLIHTLGIQDPKEALGKQILINGGEKSIITGVVQDFQSESKHKKRRPCLINYNPDRFNIASVKILPSKTKATLADVEKIWLSLYPDFLFQYEFMDEQIKNLYIQEQKLYNAFIIFSLIAILIGSLGLYGLVSFTAAQRTKEIGIRKVLGAKVIQITSLLSKEFLLLVLIACLLAWPLAWQGMNAWLENFAYRIEINLWMFLLSGIIGLLITLITVSSQTVKAAVANPVKSLRSE